MSRLDGPVLRLSVDGVAAGADLAPFVVSLSYTDHEHGQADDLEVTLDDADGRFSGRSDVHPVPWTPDQAAVLTAALAFPPHDGPARGPDLQLGTFVVDEEEFAHGATGPVVVLRAQTAAPAAARGFRATERTVAYPGPTTLRAVLDVVAARNGLRLLYAAGDRPLARADQTAATDAAFARRLCERAGVRLAVRAERPGGPLAMVVGDVAGPADAAGGAVELPITPADLAGYSVRRQSHTAAGAATCSYYDVGRGRAVAVTVRRPAADPADETLSVQAVCRTEVEARALAQAALDGRNRAGAAADFEFAPARPDVASGTVLLLAGAGQYDGRYLATSVRLSLGPYGSATSASAVRLP